MRQIDDLLASIFDGLRRDLYDEVAAWVRDSRRFRAFATTYATKIRSKLKQATDDGRMADLRAELHTAALLLRDERFSLEYERYTALKQRGPDFTVTFKTHTPFNVEVRRLRGGEQSVTDSDARATKLMGVLCDKAGQMPPAIVNLLWLTGDLDITEEDVTRATVTLRQLTERKADDYFTRRGVQSAAVFLRQYQHLSGIVLPHAGGYTVWRNPLARHKTPPEIVNAMQRLSD